MILVLDCSGSMQAEDVRPTRLAAAQAAIAWIRNRYMDTPLLSAAFQVVVGGLLVFATGIAIGSS